MSIRLIPVYDIPHTGLSIHPKTPDEFRAQVRLTMKSRRPSDGAPAFRDGGSYAAVKIPIDGSKAHSAGGITIFLPSDKSVTHDEARALIGETT